MNTSDFKRMFRHMPEVFFNQGDTSGADREIRSDYVDYVLPPQFPRGIEGLRQFVAMMRNAMPDLHYDIDHLGPDDLIGEGDKVMHRLLASGTHQGELLGIPATGRHITWTEMHIGRYENGVLVEHWGNVDVLGMFQQMGVIPAPADAGPRPPIPEPPQVTGGKKTTPEENKALMRRFIEEVWNKGNLAVADELFHPEASSPSAPQLPRGPQAVRDMATMFRTGFPDFHMTIEDMIAEADMVVGRFTQGGTHQGEFMGIAPTGRTVSFTEIGVLRIKGGQVVESWYESDILGLSSQLTAPAPSPTPAPSSTPSPAPTTA